MPAPPYFSALPLDGNNRRYVDQSAWDSVIGAFYAWPDHVNANQKDLSNLGVLTFGAGGKVSGNLAVDAGAVAISGSGADPGAAVGLWLNNSAPAGYPTSLAGYSIQFLTGGNGARAARVTIDNGGNVGIGASPANSDQKFQVRTATPNANFTISTAVSVPNAVTINAINDGASANVPMELRASLFSLNGGNVGIGTANPTSALHVYRNMTATASMLVEQANHSYNASVDATSTRSWLMQSLGGLSGADGAWRLYDATAGATRILVDSSGNVGIGTESPAATLHVAGTTWVTGYVAPASGAGVAINYTGTGYVNAYDYTSPAYRNLNVNGSILRLNTDSGGVVIQATPGSYEDSALGNRTGQLVVSEAEKKLYLRYKDSGGVCHSIELGGPYA